MDGADVCITLAHTYGAEREIGSAIAIAWAESAKPNAGIVLAFVDDTESLCNRIRAGKSGPAKEVPGGMREAPDRSRARRLLLHDSWTSNRIP